ncbi:MAG: hypothetical protein ACKORJ_04265 [Bacteroidota bacterium]
MNRCLWLLLLVAGCWQVPVAGAQDPAKKINVNIYGATDYTINKTNGKTNAFFTLGEQDFFVTSRLSDRVSFLGETVVRPDSKTGTTFGASVERAQIKYDYSATGNHSILVGKMHSPVNYWNDVYHHGRLFFPTIDRPIVFSHFIPLHTMGVRLQGQNIGSSNFGYDLMVGNGISSSDFNKTGTNFSYTASVHIKPVDGMRIQTGYYRDVITNSFSGPHSGHSQNQAIYKRPVQFNLYSLSFAYFKSGFELLSETSLNITRTDSLGRATNFSTYLYMGKRLSDTSVPYLLVDLINVSDDELHVRHLDKFQLGLGYRHEFNAQMNLKVQVMRLTDIHNNSKYGELPIPEDEKYFFKIQLAYAL